MNVSPADFRDAWILTGPTASGKTDIGMAVAERAGAEIVALDSMTLYRGLDIGTAKATAEQRERVSHHLIDCLDPWEECSLAQYLEMAHDACTRIRERGRRILFVGGTALYLKALLRGIFRGPPANREWRRQWERLAAEEGKEALHGLLRKVDAAAADRLHANDVRRVIRALEVHQATGKPISHWQQQFDQPRPADERPRVVCLMLPRELLYARINRRVEDMFERGLVDEVGRLQSLPLPLSHVARQALGYKEVFEHLTGERNLADTIELVQRRTRRFAKHQMTWFRSLAECGVMILSGDETVASVSEKMCRRLSQTRT